MPTTTAGALAVRSMSRVACAGKRGGGVYRRHATVAHHRRQSVRRAAADDGDEPESSTSSESDGEDAADLSTGQAHFEYIQSVAAIAPPAELGALAAVLHAQGMTLVHPSDRKGLHPLCVPLAKTTDGEGGRGLGVGFGTAMLRRRGGKGTLTSSRECVVLARRRSLFKHPRPSQVSTSPPFHRS